MTNCEMCGSEGKIYTSEVEGVQLKVCKTCSSYGKIVKKPAVKKKILAKKLDREIIQKIVDDYSVIIRNKREKLGLKQKEFAKYLTERESIIHKIESGNFKPSINLARKIEKQLNVSLIQQVSIEPQSVKSSSQNITIGDILKVKN